MKKILFIFTIAAFLCSGCNFLSNSFKFGDTTKVFMDNLVHKNYKKCATLMVLNGVSPDSLVAPLDRFSNIVVKNFGDKLDYTFVTAQKKFGAEENMPPHSTMLFVQYNNDKYFGMIQALFDDTSGKIINIKTLDLKEEIPNMAPFWMVGILALLVPSLIIYAIIQIKQSDMRKKWLKYIFVLILNVPAVCYKVVGGFSVLWLNFQFLFGISFAKEGYANSYWIVGIPLGSLIILWKLKTKRYTSKNAISNSEADSQPSDNETGLIGDENQTQ